MKTVTPDDEKLYRVVEAEAAKGCRSIGEVVGEALEQWLADVRDRRFGSGRR